MTPEDTIDRQIEATQRRLERLFQRASSTIGPEFATAESQQELLAILRELRRRSQELSAACQERRGGLSQQAESLQQSVERCRELERIVDRSPAVAFIWRAERGWPVEYVSNNVTQFGYVPADFYAGHVLFADIIHPDDLDRVTAEVKRYDQAGADHLTQEYRILTKSGETRWVDDRTWVGRGPNQEVTHYQGIVLDITDRRRAEQRIEHINTVLRAIRDVNQLINRESDPARLLQGICESLVKNRSYHYAWIALVDQSGKPTTAAQAGLDIAFQSLLEQLRHGQLTDCMKMALRQPDGLVVEKPSQCTECPCTQVYQDSSAMAVRLAHGDRVYGTLTVSIPADFALDEEEQALFEEIAEDIAFALHNLAVDEQRREAERALRVSEERWRSVVENAPDIIFTVDREGQILSINHPPAGLSPEQAVGTNALDYVAPEHRQITQRAIERVFETGEPDRFEISARGAHDILSWYATRLGPIKREGRVTAVVMITRDITRRKRAEETLRQTTQALRRHNQELDAFAHTVAHNLKNPVSLCIGFVELLQEKAHRMTTDQIRHHLHKIRRHGYKMNEIIDELLLLSTVREMEVRIEALDMAKILDEVQERLAHLIEERRAQITIPELWPTVMGHGPWVEEVWVNYLSNALKFGGDPPRIELGARPQPDDQVRFWVRDDGPGLTAQEQSRLFIPFTKLGQVTPGHGLGLSIVHRIVNKLEGDVGVESEPGQGCTFWFTLPRAEGP